MEEVEELEEKQAQYEEDLNNKGNMVPTYIGLGLLGYAVLSFLIFVFWGAVLPDVDLGAIGYIIVINALCPAPAAGLIGLIYAGTSFSKYKKISSKYKAASEDLPQVYARIEQLKTEVDWTPISIMPPAYRNVDALSFSCVAFINGRATTIQEAVNLYEQELHNLKMQNMAAATMLAAEEARVSANSAAVSSAISAGFSALNLLR